MRAVLTGCGCIGIARPDVAHRDNVGLREAMRLQVPLIYFHGIAALRAARAPCAANCFNCSIESDFATDHPLGNYIQQLLRLITTQRQEIGGYRNLPRSGVVQYFFIRADTALR